MLIPVPETPWIRDQQKVPLKQLPLLDSCKRLAQSLRKVVNSVKQQCFSCLDSYCYSVLLIFMIHFVFFVKLFVKFWSGRHLHIHLKMFSPCYHQIHGLVHTLYPVITTLVNILFTNGEVFFCQNICFYGSVESVMLSENSWGGFAFC